MQADLQYRGCLSNRYFRHSAMLPKAQDALLSIGSCYRIFSSAEVTRVFGLGVGDVLSSVL